jgi:hypothetical protein
MRLPILNSLADAHHGVIMRSSLRSHSACKETIMDANQRSEINNQTNNGANEKWTPGSKGKTADNGQPLDHTYPQGSGTQQLGSQGIDTMGTQQTGAGPGVADGSFQRSDALNQTGVPGGSMETQINGGSGPVQGITDSHQRQMEQKSGAYGMLEQPVGDRPNDSGVNLNQQRDMSRDVVRGQMASQNAAQPDQQGGSLGPRHGSMQAVQSSPQGGSTQGGGMLGPQGNLPPHAPAGSMGNRQSTQGGDMAVPQGHDGEEAQRGNTQLGVSGSNAMANQNSDFGGVHESNDVAGGLPRSPGNAGANAGASTDRAGSQTGAGAADSGPAVHDSNDAAGGYPRSPGFANRLAGDQNMDDDTGFKRK